MTTTRRGFLSRLGAAALGALGARLIGARPAEGAEEAPIPKRPLGRTGVEVSLLGLGGWHLGVPDRSQAIAIAQEAVDAGVTFLDNAADYHDGESERRMGEALAAGGRREKVFLMTKCCDHARTRDGSLRSLEESLKRLRTDRLDLWQLHDVTRAEDPADIFRKGGAIEAVEEAKRSGKVRFAGFTGHRDPKLFLEVLKRGFAWDTVQMPLSPADPHHRSFEREVLPALRERGIGVIGMKSVSSGALPKSGVVTAEECIRYAMSLPVATVVCGIDSRDVLRQDLAVVRPFKPLDEKERAALVAKLAGVAAGGKLESHKAP